MTPARLAALLLIAGSPTLVFQTAPAFAQTAPAGDATARVQAFYDALLETMKQADALGLKGREAKLRPVLTRTFDLPAMTRISVGPDWAKLSEPERIELTTAFSDMVIATYANRFDGWSGESFVVTPTPRPVGNDRIVETRLVKSDGGAVPLNYLVRGTGEAARIVDVYLNGTVSELATKRADYAATLKAGGATALIAKLKDQTARLLAGG